MPQIETSYALMVRRQGEFKGDAETISGAWTENTRV